MVSFFPEAKSASVSELRSLDLIVARFREVQCFAICCHHQRGDDRIPAYLLLRPEFGDDNTELILQEDVVGDEVVTFGDDYRFDIDATLGSVVFPNKTEDVLGLVLSGDKKFFLSKIGRSSETSQLAVIDLATGAVTDRYPEGPKALVTKWGISVGLGAEEKPVVVIPTQ